MVNEISNVTSLTNSRPVEVVSARQQQTSNNNKTDQTARTASPTEVVKQKVQEEKQEASQPKSAEIESAVRSINDFVQKISRSLQFTVDDDSGTTVIKVIDKTTDELVRQIPSEEVLNIRRRLNEVQSMIYDTETPGLLFKDSV